MIFWVIICVLALLVVLMLTLSVFRGRQGEEGAEAYDLRIYRDQLNEVDRDLARGVISAEEAERVRTEVSRRILAADTKLQTQGAVTPEAPATKLVVPVLAMLVILGGSLWLYQRIGTPNYPDMPIGKRIAASDEARANRMTQAQAEARLPTPPPPAEQASEDFLNLMERLRETVANRPDDLQGLSLLARNEAALGNLQAAIDAQTRIIEIRDDAASAADHTYLAELKIGAANGYVSQEAEAALRTALKRDPRYPFALYYLAQYHMQVDRPDAAFRLLEGLLRDSPPNAPWVAAIRETIEEIAWRAGEEYELPPEGARGPSADDIAAAQDMAPEERIEMIRGMVAGLSDRLATEGGTADDWARLIRALGILDEKAQANTIWAEARAVFADDPSALRRLHSAAQDAEIAQ